MTTSGRAATARHPGERHRYRHPSDVARLVFNLILLGALALLSWAAPSGLRALGTNVLDVIDGLPRSLVEGLVGTVQLVAIAAPVGAVVALIGRRRLTLLAILATAALFAAGLMALLADAFANTVPADLLAFDRYDSWLIGGQFPSSAYLCGATATLVAAGPWLSRRWRHAGWVFLGAVVAARVLTATEVPVRIGMLLTLGAAAGSLVLVALGGPRRRIDEETLITSLAGAGFAVRELIPGPADEGVPTFTAVAADGSRTLVKVLGRDERDTDLLIQTWRRLTLRGLGDDTPTGSPARVVDHEALALGLFRSAGVRVATPIATVLTPDDAAMLVTSPLDDPHLADLPPAEITDGMLDAVWQSVARLQRRRFAHRRLNPRHILVTADTATIVDLRRADLHSSDEVLGADIAELLASLTALVGAERAVAAAARALPTVDLARALPLIQSAVLTPETRRAYRHDDAGLADLRNRVAAVAAVADVELAPVNRITVKGAVTLVGSMVLGYYLLSLAANWQSIWEAFQDANLAYVVPILALTTATYVTGSVSLLGAVTTHLALMRTTAVMFGQSFLNRFTPANAGGMAMRVRYLQLNGIDTPVAATAIGLTSAASGVAQGLLIVVFFVWGGATDRFSDFSLPSFGTILIVVLVGGLAVTGVLYSHWGRTIIRPWVHGAVTKIRGTLGELARSPAKLSMLLGGAILGKLCNIISFWLSTLAFGVDMSFPKAGALYMIANTVGSAVPTPGGVGGVEAALTAVLIGFGVDNATAAAVVLFFRTLTFWVPTLPGYGFLQYSQRKGFV